MHLAAVHRGAIAESRKLKPEISLFGVGGRSIEDEVEFELVLEYASRQQLRPMSIVSCNNPRARGSLKLGMEPNTDGIGVGG